MSTQEPSAANALEQPTPRPWKIHVTRDGNVEIIGGPRGMLIAVESVGREDAARGMADAELIVAAVNAHDDLAELIEACLGEHHIATAGPRQGLMVHSDCAICEWLASHPRSPS